MSQVPPPIPPDHPGHVRRIVTGHDAQGRSIVTEDQAAPSVHTNPKRVGYCLTQLWMTDQTPAFVGNEPDPTTRPLKLEPPKNGSVVRIITFGPEGDWIRQIDAEATKLAWGAIGTSTASTNTTGQAKHPFMHRTRSVDYALVLEGEIHLVLDQEEVLMRTGDFLVERGTNHAWANRSGKPCKILFVLIDGAFDPEIAQHFDAAGH
jgi:mannose-6-phosphate isomerase-like protein (cupin superfamily)